MPLPRGELLRVVLGAAARGERLAEDARRILEDGGYQRSLPQESPPLELHSLSLGPLDTLLRILLWALLVVAALVALAWLVQRLRGRARDILLEPEQGPVPLAFPVTSAERLAAEGRYAEAIHVLLLETLAALSRARKLAPSLTSREIVGRVALPRPAREALTGLVQAVEISRFGGAPAGEPDYRACLERFHAFLETSRLSAQKAQEAAA